VNEYKKPSGVPWRVWAALLVVSFIIILAYRFYPPSFEHSSPQLAVHGDIVSVEFDAINHARTPITKTLSVSVGTVRYGSKKGGPRYTPLDHKEVSVSLAPSETKHVRCDFPSSGRFVTNGAEVTIRK
jgi:hypothetical protein